MTMLEHSVPAGEVIPRLPPIPDSCRTDCVCVCMCVSKAIERESERETEAVINERGCVWRLRKQNPHVCESAGVLKAKYKVALVLCHEKSSFSIMLNSFPYLQ